MTKQTSANNKTLQTIKKLFNAKIYKHVAQVYNDQGEDMMYWYLQAFYRSDVSARIQIEAAMQLLGSPSN
jgi:hypothetical protein